MTRLYDYWRSSASYRVRMALNLLGEGFEAIPVDLLQAEQVGAANMARNPQGLVPSLVLDDGEVHLKRGDIVVQRGTNHAWSNRSEQMARMVFILLDGRYAETLKELLP